MKKLVLSSLPLVCSLAQASDVRDYCTNVDSDVGSLYGNLHATYYEKGEEQIFHFEEDDYSVKEDKKVVFEEIKDGGSKDIHYALSLTVTFNKKVAVPSDTNFNSVFEAAKTASSVKVHLICRDYSTGSPLPPPASN